VSIVAVQGVISLDLTLEGLNSSPWRVWTAL